ncbi:AAA family ATPase [Candidatus Acetothermia bacterium]|nr:AAA family ATPase [Candidatus Acetothermia bacterium]
MPNPDSSHKVPKPAAGPIDLSPADRTLFSQIVRLPWSEWNSLWSRIHLPEGVKQHAKRVLILQGNLRIADLDPVTSVGKGLFFYGPPGTGKTSIARGLANEFATAIDKEVLLIEIATHQLSSEELGKGPKQVEMAFERVAEFATSGMEIICFLDEVESVGANRSQSLSGADPKDVARMTNAALQGIDHLSRLGNVHLIVTSNLPKGVDSAFLDRMYALYVPLPDALWRCLILQDALAELNDKLNTKIRLPLNGRNSLSIEGLPKQWKRLLVATEGLSGRQLRKLVFVALAGREETTKQPSTLTLNDLINTVEKAQAQRRQDVLSGGVYDYYTQPIQQRRNNGQQWNDAIEPLDRFIS